MKKLLLAAAIAIAAACPLVALEGYDVQTIHQETGDKFVTIDLAWTETTRNLVVVYKVKYRAFDEGDAFIAIRDTVRKFADEHGFKSYKTYSDDIIRYHGNETELTRFIILDK
jgi:hypothetical protein